MKIKAGPIGIIGYLKGGKLWPGPFLAFLLPPRGLVALAWNYDRTPWTWADRRMWVGVDHRVVFNQLDRTWQHRLTVALGIFAVMVGWPSRRGTTALRHLDARNDHKIERGEPHDLQQQIPEGRSSFSGG